MQLLDRIFIDIKSIAKTIYRAEIWAQVRKESVGQIIEEYADSLTSLDREKYKRDSKELRKISSKLKAAHEKEYVYKDYLPPMVISLLSGVRESGLQSEAGNIFKEFAPIQELGESFLGKIKKKMIMPFVLFTMAIFGFRYVLDEFKPVFAAGDIKIGDSVLWVVDNFLLIMGGYGLIFAIAFLILPEKMPVLSVMFRKIKGLMAVSLTLIMYRLSMPASQIIPLLIKSFNLKGVKMRGRENLDDLTYLLYIAKYIDGYQASDIRNSRFFKSDDTGSLKDTLEKVMLEKKEEILELDDVLQDAVKNMSLLLLFFPLGTVLYVIGSIFMAVSSIM